MYFLFFRGFKFCSISIILHTYYYYDYDLWCCEREAKDVIAVLLYAIVWFICDYVSKNVLRYLNIIVVLLSMSYLQVYIKLN